MSLTAQERRIRDHAYGKKYRSKLTPEQKQKRLTSNRASYKTRAITILRRLKHRKAAYKYFKAAQGKSDVWSRILYQGAKYRKLHPGKIKEFKRKRRLLEFRAEGWHTHEEWEDLKIKCEFKCLHCRRSEPEIDLTEDHIIPLKRGGNDWIDNIQPLCRSCNSRKGAKILI